MRGWLVIGIAGLMMWSSAAPALANGAEDDSASVQITVNIPPFAAGLTAQAEGAVGLWTMTELRSTLMVKLPDALTEDNAAEAAIFTSASTPFRVTTSDPTLTLTHGHSKADNGLVRHGFALSLTRVPRIFESRFRDATTVIISGV